MSYIQIERKAQTTVKNLTGWNNIEFAFYSYLSYAKEFLDVDKFFISESDLELLNLRNCNFSKIGDVLFLEKSNINPNLVITSIQNLNSNSKKQKYLLVDFRPTLTSYDQFLDFLNCLEVNLNFEAYSTFSDRLGLSTETANNFIFTGLEVGEYDEKILKDTYYRLHRNSLKEITSHVQDNLQSRAQLVRKCIFFVARYAKKLPLSLQMIIKVPGQKILQYTKEKS